MRNILKAVTAFIFCLTTLLSACYEPTPPEVKPLQIILKGDNPLKIGIYSAITGDTVQINDPFGLDTSWSISDVDTALLGRYKKNYYARSLSGAVAEAERDIWVVVKPKSMADTWQIEVVSDKNEQIIYSDSLEVKSNILIINNFNNIEGAEISLELASDLQDSIYITEQALPDLEKAVIGKGVINEKATIMELDYAISSEGDTVRYHAVYKRTIATE